MSFSINPNCSYCPELVSCRHQVVQGYGKPGAKIMVVSQNPSPWDDQKGRPLIGKQGKILSIICERAGIRLSDVYRTNAVRCASPGNREPSIEEIRNCRDYLIKEIKDVNPAVIVALGKVPLTSLYAMDSYLQFESDMTDWEAECDYARIQHEALHETYAVMLEGWEAAPRSQRGLKPKKPNKNPKLPPKPKKGSTKNIAVKDVAGHVLIQPDTGIPMISSYHPSFIMRGNWAYETLVVRHLERARKVANGDLNIEPTQPDYPVVSTIDQLEALRDYLLSDDVECIWFDLETTGTKWMDDEILCLSISDGSGDAWVIPFLHNDGMNLVEYWDEDIGHVLEILREIFSSDKDKGGHNLIFDVRFLEREPVEWVSAGTAFGIKVNLG